MWQFSKQTFPLQFLVLEEIPGFEKIPTGCFPFIQGNLLRVTCWTGLGFLQPAVSREQSLPHAARRVPGRCVPPADRAGQGEQRLLITTLPRRDKAGEKGYQQPLIWPQGSVITQCTTRVPLRYACTVPGLTPAQGWGSVCSDRGGRLPASHTAEQNALCSFSDAVLRGRWS